MDDELLLPCEKNGCDMAAIGVMRSSGSIVSMRSIIRSAVLLLVSGEATTRSLRDARRATRYCYCYCRHLSLSLSLACV